MNTESAELLRRSDVLELWWLKARRSASGQNYAAERAGQVDGLLTVLNISLPVTVFALGLCSSFAKYFNVVSDIKFTDLITAATGLILAMSSIQFAGDYKAKSIEHRRASNDFDALAQQIEAIEFRADNDVVFYDINSRLQTIRQTSRHVSKRDWAPAREKFKNDIATVREKLRPSAR